MPLAEAIASDTRRIATPILTCRNPTGMVDPIRSHPDNTTLDNWWQTKLTQAPEILNQNGIDALWWGFELFGDGIVQDAAELNQTIKIVLSTQQGSDLHRPEFSSGIWNFIDYPIPRATPFVVRDSVQAIATWEPRVSLDTVSVQPYSPGISGLMVNAQWAIAETDVTGQTEVEIG
ncbi:MAG: GPW/gp25 family protein [Oculatellaceae cyanobacterium bins.114]|nr:GPW/gp25 family protein [Oculatellaceae cyanobacterium bins.114]